LAAALAESAPRDRSAEQVTDALGESPATVIAEMGHTDPALALRIYAQSVRRETGAGIALRGLLEAAHVMPSFARDAVTDASN